MNRINHTGQHLRMAAICLCILAFCYICNASSDAVKLGTIPIPSLCAFKLISGFDCPGCGITRALTMAMHGQFRQSYMMHIWGIPLLFVLGGQVPYRLFRALSNSEHAARLPDGVNPWVSRFVLLSMMLPWVIKSLAILLVRYL